MHSPKRREIHPPTPALAAALAAETGVGPFKKLTFAAVDTIADAREVVIESLLAYLDTDGLCYFADNEVLHARQKQLLAPVLNALQQRFDVAIETTQGLLPLEQPEELHKRMQAFMQAMDDYHLTALLTLTQLGGSLLLGVACMAELVEEQSFTTLAWLEEDFQREKNGADDEDEKRRLAKRLEAKHCFEFMRLLAA